MRNVVISYAREDQGAANLIANRLKKAGVSVFVAEASLVAGGNWSAQLRRAVQEASAVVVLLSANSRKGTWVDSEVQTVLESKRLVVPVLLDAQAKDNWIWPLVSNRQSFVLDVETTAVHRQLDSLAAALETSAPTSAPAVRTWFAVVAILIALLSASGVVIKMRTEAREKELERDRLAQQVQLERQQKAAAQQARAEQDRFVADLQEQLRRQKEAERLIVEGAQFASKGHISQAIDCYNEAIQFNPDSPVAYQLLGYSYLRRAQMKRGTEPTDLMNAIQSLERSLELDPKYVWASYNLALAYWEIGRHQDAISAVGRVLKIDPSFRAVITGDSQFRKFHQSPEFRALLQGR